MGKKLLLILFMGIAAFCSTAQSCVQANLDTLIPCSQSCVALQVKIPNPRQSGDYNVVSAPFLPFPYTCPSDVELTSINIDDKFSAVINLPFTVCFYGQNYTQAVIGSNGLMTFDIANAGCNNAYVLRRNAVAVPLPDNGGNICGAIGTVYYPKACIMGAYHDIYPNATNAVTAGRRIDYYFTGTAPSRKMVVNYYHVPMFSCTTQICDEQIVVYESTGIIDVNIGEKPICTAWNEGLAILGIQNWNRDQAVTAPGKNCTVWSASHETFRFVPSVGAPLFRKVELYHGATLIAVGDTIDTGTGEYQVNFPNTCFTGDTAIFRVVTTYASCVDGALTEMETLINVRHPNTIPISVLIQPGTCATNGNNTVMISNPIGSDYEYSADGINWQTSPTFSLPGGQQNIRVRNAMQCGNRSLILPALDAIRMTAQTTATKCYGSADGTILINPLAGTAPFQYSADNGLTFQTSNVFTKPAGTYNIRMKDINNCIKDTAIVVTQPDSVKVTAIVNAAFCSGTPDGSIIATAIGGTPDYQYSITGANWQSTNTLAANVGTYTITVKDANNCPGRLTGIVVPLNDTMRLSPLPDTTVCSGSSLAFMPNTNATQYLWSPAATLTGFNAANPVASPTDTTTYYLEAKLGTLCSRRDTFVVNVLKPPVANAGSDTTICYETLAQLHATAIRGNSFTWTPTTGLSNPAIANPVVDILATTVYTVSVTDPYNCGFVRKDSVMVSVRPKVRAYAGQDTTATLGTPVQLFGCCMNLYRWTPSGIFVSDTARNPIGNFPPGTNEIIMLTTTPEGCSGKDTVIVKGYEGPTYYVPGGFSPGNRDGRNDVFRPIPVGIEETFYFNVFNRYGQLVFTTKTFMSGWDGTFNGMMQPEGVYVWMVKGRSFEGKIVEKKGTVMLIR